MYDRQLARANRYLHHHELGPKLGIVQNRYLGTRVVADPAMGLKGSFSKHWRPVTSQPLFYVLRSDLKTFRVFYPKHGCMDLRASMSRGL